MRKTCILLALLILALSSSTSADEPHRMFLPAIPISNGGCVPVIGDPTPATVVYIPPPSVTVEVLSPCDPVSHIATRVFYQDEAHPTGYWTTWAPIQEARFTVLKQVWGRNQIWIEFTSLSDIPYSVETKTP